MRAKDLRRMLLTYGGQLQVSQIQSALAKLNISVGNPVEFITRHGDKFRLDDTGVYVYFEEIGSWVV